MEELQGKTETQEFSARIHSLSLNAFYNKYQGFRDDCKISNKFAPSFVLRASVMNGYK